MKLIPVPTMMEAALTSEGLEITDGIPGMIYQPDQANGLFAILECTKEEYLALYDAGFRLKERKNLQEFYEAALEHSSTPGGVQRE